MPLRFSTDFPPRAGFALGRYASLLLVLAVWWPAVGLAQSDGGKILGIEAGFEGTYRVGKWAPVWVELDADEAARSSRLEIVTPDGDGVPATYAALDDAPETVAGGSLRRLVYVKFGRTQTWLTVRLRDGEQVRAERRFPAGSFPQPQPVAREVVLSLGGDFGVAEAADLSRRRGSDAYLACRQQEPARLPDRWFGYDGVDCVVLAAANADYLAAWSDPQVEALFQWMSQGGRLIVSGGGPLPERWSGAYPGGQAEPQLLRRTSALEVYAGASQRLATDATAGTVLPVTVLDEPQGRVLLADQVAGQSQPLLLLAPRGFGMLLFSALDLTAEPLASWRDRPRLVLRLLRMGDEADDAAGELQRSGGRVTHIGYEDLSGQLRAALENFSIGGRRLIPFSWVAGLILLYILLIGPADYFFLRRVVRRMEFTWVTFPLIAIVLAIVAVVLTGIYKGDAFAVRQLAVVDYDLASGTRRVAVWAHLYSPRTGRCDLAMTQPGDSLLSWHGLPGSALGGMDSAAPAPAADVRYHLRDTAEGDRLHLQPRGVPINVWSTKSFHGYAWSAVQKDAQEDALRRSTLRETYDRRLAGQVVNATEWELVECQVLYDRWAYSIRGVIAPGDVIQLADEGEPRDLEWKMTRRVVSEDHKAVSTPWNPRDLDVDRIVEMMMLHRAVGGASYTELRHRQMAQLDLSRHLRIGRAVLLAKIRSPEAALMVNGDPLAAEDDSGWTYLRMVIPVEPQ